MLHPFSQEQNQGDPVIELKDVWCGYGQQTVLSNVNLTVMAGEFVGLLGPSGSGKTTLLKVMMGAMNLLKGEVLVEGFPARRRKPKAGYVPQLETIDWDFPVTVLQVVMMGATMSAPLFPWYKSRDRERAYEMLDRLGIAKLSKRPIRELSGGEQQRVFLARALVSNPRLLLLDEPTAGVDIKTRDDVMHLLHELNHQGVTIVLTTHEINTVAAHLPSVVCLNGTVLAKGPPSEVFTPEIFKITYDAELPVIQYQGMTLVAESPHFFESNDS